MHGADDRCVHYALSRRGASPTGAWAGQAGKLGYFSQTWQFITPREGMTIWVNDEDLRYSYNGSAWVQQ